MLWKLPPRVKILEALGCIGDKRIMLDEKNKNKAIVKSSNLDRVYKVSYYPEKRKFFSDDNASKFHHYIGYPLIAVVMLNKTIDYNKRIAEALKGIKWNNLNKRFKRDYQKTEKYALDICEKKGISKEEVNMEIERVLKRLNDLKLEF